MTAYQPPVVFTGEVFRTTTSTASAWSVLRPWQQGLFIILSIAILFSALSVVLVQHAHRQQMRELHASMIQRDELNHAWSQLLVEQSAWAAFDHVETTARQQLGMVIPDLSQVTYLNMDVATQGRRIAEATHPALPQGQAALSGPDRYGSDENSMMVRQKSSAGGA